jgi:hypothetical protein
MRRLLSAAIAAAGVVMAGEAMAQGSSPSAQTYLADRSVWLQDRSLLEGRGIRTGNFELHPGIGVDFGFDSNVFNASSSLPNAQQSALRLRVAPSFYVSTLGQQRSSSSDSATTALPTVNFRGGVGLVYHEWIGLSTSTTRDVSSLRNLGAQATLRFDFFPQRTWQFGIGADYVRLIQPGVADDVRDASGSTRSVGSETFNRNTVVGALDVAYAPGRGVFELRFGYNIIANIFDNVGFNNSMTNQGFARMRWRFLPKTALVWEGSVGRLTYLNTAGATTGLFDATPVATRFGMTGLLTNRVSLLVLAGYQGTFYERGDNADTIVGQAEVQWLIDARSRLRGGFLRDVQPAAFGNFFTRNRGYVNYMQAFSGRFVLSVDAGVALNQYGYIANRATGTPLTPVSGVDATTGRFNTVRVDGTLFAEYRLSDVFGINASVRGEALLSEVKLGAQQLPIDWTRVDAFLGARANW